MTVICHIFVPKKQIYQYLIVKQSAVSRHLTNKVNRHASDTSLLVAHILNAHISMHLSFVQASLNTLHIHWFDSSWPTVIHIFVISTHRLEHSLLENWLGKTLVLPRVDCRTDLLITFTALHWNIHHLWIIIRGGEMHSNAVGGNWPGRIYHPGF